MMREGGIGGDKGLRGKGEKGEEDVRKSEWEFYIVVN